MQKLFSATLLLAVATTLTGKAHSQAQPTPPAKKTTTTPAKPATTGTKPSTATTSKTGTAAPLTTKKDKFSYALGMSQGAGMAANFKKLGIEFNPTLIIQGLKDGLAGGKTRLTEDEAHKILSEMQAEVQKQQQEKIAQLAETNKKEGEAFLAANKAKEGVVTLPSGLEYKIVTPGTGPKPAATDTVVCNYKGTFLNGNEFDNSYKRGKPETFGVNQVIKGWTEALELMPVGSHWQLFVPSDLAYGPGGRPGIPPNSALIFDVELLSIQPKAPETKAPDAAQPGVPETPQPAAPPDKPQQ